MGNRNTPSPFNQGRQKRKQDKKKHRADAKKAAEKMAAWEALPQADWSLERRVVNGIATEGDVEALNKEATRIRETIHTELPALREVESKAAIEKNGAEKKFNAAKAMFESVKERAQEVDSSDPGTTEQSQADAAAYDAEAEVEKAETTFKEAEQALKDAHSRVNDLVSDLGKPANKRRIKWLEKYLETTIQ